MQEEAVMYKRQYTHESVVNGGNLRSGVFFPSGSATAKTRDFKIIFSEQKCMRGGGEEHVRMGCGGRFCFRRLQVLTALDLSKELI